MRAGIGSELEDVLWCTYAQRRSVALESGPQDGAWVGKANLGGLAKGFKEVGDLFVFCQYAGMIGDSLLLYVFDTFGTK